MFNHIVLGTNDSAAAKQFYDATLGSLGASPCKPDAKGRLTYFHDGGLLLITPPIDGKPATHANGGTIGFKMSDTAQVDAWHAAGCANGGTSCEDPPGWREGDFGRLYLAYLRDPAGNKLCGVYRD